ncbi:MAG: hypothetical protein WAU25_12875 [Nitrososphaeraceae archaeon]
MDRHTEGVHQRSLPTIALVTYIIKTIKAAANVRIAAAVSKAFVLRSKCIFL